MQCQYCEKTYSAPVYPHHIKRCNAAPSLVEAEKPLDKMKVDELLAYAEEREIEIEEGALKSDILETIQIAIAIQED